MFSNFLISFFRNVSWSVEPLIYLSVVLFYHFLPLFKPTLSSGSRLIPALSDTQPTQMNLVAALFCQSLIFFTNYGSPNFQEASRISLLFRINAYGQHLQPSEIIFPYCHLPGQDGGYVRRLKRLPVISLQSRQVS